MTASSPFPVSPTARRLRVLVVTMWLLRAERHSGRPALVENYIQFDREVER